MKTIILMRHAKAVKESPTGIDFDRPLEERGKTDAALMAKHLKDLKFNPDFVISSPAKRTQKTAQIMIKEMGLNKVVFEQESNLFEADLQDVMHVIREISDKYDRVLLVGHNPSITGMLGYLTPDFIEHVSTSGMACIELDIETWRMTQTQKGQLLWYKSPKQ